MRRLPKPVVAMVAGWAAGGGHVLHLCCDLTIAADNARFGQTGPRVGSWDGGFGASLLRDLVGTKKAKEFWLLCRTYDAEEAREMGLVNAVVPLERLEHETVAWCREMLAPLPLRPAPGQGELQRPRGRLRGDPAARPRRQPPLLRQRGGAARAARPTRRSASPTSRKFPRATMRIWLMAARPRTLPAAIAPVLVGTAAAVEWVGHLPRVGGLRRRPPRQRLHPDRDEPRQRLLRRKARRRHRRPPRPGPGDLGRPGRPAAGADSDLGRVRDRGRLRDLPRRRSPAP